MINFMKVMKLLFSVILFMSVYYANAFTFSYDYVVCDSNVDWSSNVKKFYVEYLKVDKYVYDENVDSVMNIYCTKELCEKAKKWMWDGHDLVTGDELIDNMSWKSVAVFRKSNYEYVVTFHSFFKDEFDVQWSANLKMNVTTTESGKVSDIVCLEDKTVNSKTGKSSELPGVKGKTIE